MLRKRPFGEHRVATFSVIVVPPAKERTHEPVHILQKTSPPNPNKQTNKQDSEKQRQDHIQLLWDISLACPWLPLTTMPR
jgi:hypothetical protein